MFSQGCRLFLQALCCDVQNWCGVSGSKSMVSGYHPKTLLFPGECASCCLCSVITAANSAALPDCGRGIIVLYYCNAFRNPWSSGYRPCRWQGV